MIQPSLFPDIPPTAPSTRFNLLDETLLSLAAPGGTRIEASLPEALARLGAGERIEFTALRPHQFSAWYDFLVQLAAQALHRAGESQPPREARRWRELVLRLTDGRIEPWCLIVEDLGQPAFLQPPVPEGTPDALKKSTDHPDGIDVLITAKNHDLKTRRIVRPRPEHWVYALVTLQTTEGFLGAGNYGISRMNGGFASRPHYAVEPGASWPERFHRDVAAWLKNRSKLVESHGFRDEGGLGLVWLEPWDGTESLPFSDLDPFYIEICRRMRLVLDGSRIVARGASTKAARLQAKERKGDTGDVWTPVSREDRTSLTVGGSGLTYRLMQELIAGEEYQPGAAGEFPEKGPAELVVIASVLVRGQGKTEGFHERMLTVGGRVRALFGTREGRSKIGLYGAKQVQIVRDFQSRVLRPALCVLIQGGPDAADLRDDRVGGVLRQFDAEIDRIFFEHLWQVLEADLPQEDAEARWQRRVYWVAKQLLREACDSLPVPLARRYRAIALAMNLFYGSTRKNFAAALVQEEGGANESERD